MLGSLTPRAILLPLHKTFQLHVFYFRLLSDNMRERCEKKVPHLNDPECTSNSASLIYNVCEGCCCNCICHQLPFASIKFLIAGRIPGQPPFFDNERQNGSTCQPDSLMEL